MLKFAKVTTDPEMAAGLVEKAADMKELAEDARAERGREGERSVDGAWVD